MYRPLLVAVPKCCAEYSQKISNGVKLLGLVGRRFVQTLALRPALE